MQPLRGTSILVDTKLYTCDIYEDPKYIARYRLGSFLMLKFINLAFALLLRDPFYSEKFFCQQFVVILDIDN